MTDGMTAGMTDTPLLEVRDITAGFGAVTVLHGVSFEVPRGSIAGVFGLNGAGKSVTMKCIAGVVPTRSGAVLFDGEDITTMSPERRVARGMGHVPQGRQVFPDLTVEENLRLGAYTLRRRNKSRYAASLDGVFDRFPVLRDRRTQKAGTMSGGQQASLAVGRALINDPKIVLIDEPSAGLAPAIVEDLLEVLQQVRATGLTMVLVEQNIRFGLRLSDSACLLQKGRIVYSGDTGDLDEDRLAGYLGVGRLLGRDLAAGLSRPKPRGRRR